MTIALRQKRAFAQKGNDAMKYRLTYEHNPGTILVCSAYSLTDWIKFQNEKGRGIRSQSGL